MQQRWGEFDHPHLRLMLDLKHLSIFCIVIYPLELYSCLQGLLDAWQFCLPVMLKRTLDCKAEILFAVSPWADALLSAGYAAVVGAEEPVLWHCSLLQGKPFTFYRLPSVRHLSLSLAYFVDAWFVVLGDHFGRIYWWSAVEIPNFFHVSNCMYLHVVTYGFDVVRCFLSCHEPHVALRSYT